MVADSGTYDESTIMRRRKIAEAMLSDATKPQKIEHWTQGLAQLARAGIGGYLTNQADEEKKAEDYREKADFYRQAGQPLPPPPTSSPSIFERMASAMGGETAPVTPAAPAMTPPMGTPIPQVAAQPPVAPSGPGKIYTNDEPSPLDPPSGIDRKAMIATILGEAGNQGPQGMNAVGSVIRNRAVNGGFGGDTPTGVVTAKNQFEPWNTEAGRSKMSAAMADPKQAAAADQAIALAYGEGGQAPVDPTNGAMNFIAPKAQAALGRDMPKWAQGPGQDIGDHRFFGGKPQDPQAPYQVAGPPTAAPGGAPAVAQAMGAPPVQPTQPSGIFAGVPQDKIPGILQGLTSKNPTMKALAVQQLGNYTKADAPTDETKEYKLAQSQGYKGSFIDFKTELKKAGATNVTTNVGGGSDKQIFDTMDESAKAARATAQGLAGLREARAAIQGGAITGAGADTRLALQKVGALIGVADPAKIVNTETFRSAIAPQVSAMVKSTVGTTNISNSDREFAEKAAGGNINLDEKSISRLLDIMERASVAQLEAHQKRLDKVYGDPEKYGRERALFGVDMPTAAPISAAKPSEEGWKDLGGGIRIREKK